MHIVSNIALISINETLFIQLISFLIFLFLINRIMFRPVKKIMGDRVDYMEDLKQAVVDADKEIARLTEQLAEKESAARAEALSLKKEIEELALDKASEIQQAARDEIAELNNKNFEEVKTQITEARQHLQTEAEALVTGIMEKVLNRRFAS